MKYFARLVLFVLVCFTLPQKGYAAAGPEIDVAIVGGGLSGLRAAQRLQKEGVDYQVYEGRDRLGGRVVSTDGFNDGGEWIEKEHKEMQALAKSLGVELQKDNFDNPIRVLLPDGTELATLPDKIAFLGGIISKLRPALNEPMFNVDNKFRSLADVLPDTLTEPERAFIRTFVSADDGLSPEHVNGIAAVESLIDDFGDFVEIMEAKQGWTPKFFRNMKAYQYRVRGGMSRMVDALADKLDRGRINLGHRLTRITKDENNRFHLFFEHAGAVTEVIAKAVILTLPYSVLRTLDLDASLGLTALHTKAIRDIPYATTSKIQVLDDVERPIRYGVDTETGTIAWRPPSRRGLTIFMGGEQGANLTNENAPPLAATALARFSQPVGEGAPAELPPLPPLRVINWSKDPFALGCYALRSPDYTLNIPSTVPGLEGFMSFADPVGALIYAGEGTQVDNGYLESAVRSGRMAAEYYLNHRAEFD